MKDFNFHVKPIGLFDMLHFKNAVPKGTQYGILNAKNHA